MWIVESVASQWKAHTDGRQAPGETWGHHSLWGRCQSQPANPPPHQHQSLIWRLHRWSMSKVAFITFNILYLWSLQSMLWYWLGSFYYFSFLVIHDAPSFKCIPCGSFSNISKFLNYSCIFSRSKVSHNSLTIINSLNFSFTLGF